MNKSVESTVLAYFNDRYTPTSDVTTDHPYINNLSDIKKSLGAWKIPSDHIRFVIAYRRTSSVLLEFEARNFRKAATTLYADINTEISLTTNRIRGKKGEHKHRYLQEAKGILYDLNKNNKHLLPRI